MKKIVTFSLAGLLAGPTATYIHTSDASTDTDAIILESPLLSMFDGSAVGINADVIELIGLIRREINKILIGEKAPNGSMVGRYLIDGKRYAVQDLVLVEAQASQPLHKDLTNYLEIAKKDLQSCVEPFIESIRSVKSQLLELSKESCRKRGIHTSTLLRLLEVPEGDEIIVFNEEIISFARYNAFCTDLLNFLGDLIRSCPRGMAQFKMRSDKCQKARAIIKEIVKTKRAAHGVSHNDLEQKFMRHLKEHHIDKLTITEITQEKLEPLFIKFINQKN